MNFGRAAVEDLNNAIGLLLLLVGVWLAAPPVVAARKGYSAAPWLCAIGLVGVAVLAAFPRVNQSESPADRARLRAIADRVGWGLSAVGAAGWAGLCLLSSAGSSGR